MGWITLSLCEMLNASFGSWNWQALIPRLIVVLVILLQLLRVDATREWSHIPIHWSCNSNARQTNKVVFTADANTGLTSKRTIAMLKTYSAAALHGENSVQIINEHGDVIMCNWQQKARFTYSDVPGIWWMRTRRMPLQLLWLCQKCHHCINNMYQNTNPSYHQLVTAWAVQYDKSNTCRLRILRMIPVPSPTLFSVIDQHVHHYCNSVTSQSTNLQDLCQFRDEVLSVWVLTDIKSWIWFIIPSIKTMKEHWSWILPEFSTSSTFFNMTPSSTIHSANCDLLHVDLVDFRKTSAQKSYVSLRRSHQQHYTTTIENGYCPLDPHIANSHSYSSSQLFKHVERFINIQQISWFLDISIIQDQHHADTQEDIDEKDIWIHGMHERHYTWSFHKLHDPFHSCHDTLLHNTLWSSVSFSLTSNSQPIAALQSQMSFLDDSTEPGKDDKLYRCIAQ